MRRAVLFATPAALITFALLLAGCHGPGESQSAEVDAALARYVPADTLVLVQARLQGLDSLQASPVYQKYLVDRPVPLLDDFARGTGLDLRKDIAVLLVCSDGKQSACLARGNFNPAVLEPKIIKQGAARFDYKGHRLLGNETSAVVFVNSTTAMAGPTPFLRAILDRGGHSAPPVWLTALVHTIPAASQIWVALSGRGLNLSFPRNSNFSNLNRIVGAIESGVLYVDLRQGINLTANGTCFTDGDARQIHDVLKGFIGMGRLSTPDNRPEMLRLYDSFQVNQNQKAIHINASIPPDLVDQFFKLFMK
ncbi:MAG TPA: hypothetical protein VKV15_23235 [Bryobacteraceae bacterium]|nr:hypothetical protein [Bryobacteraceae bacterium]